MHDTRLIPYILSIYNAIIEKFRDLENVHVIDFEKYGIHFTYFRFKRGFYLTD